MSTHLIHLITCRSCLSGIAHELKEGNRFKLTNFHGQNPRLGYCQCHCRCFDHCDCDRCEDGCTLNCMCNCTCDLKCSCIFGQCIDYVCPHDDSQKKIRMECRIFKDNETVILNNRKRKTFFKLYEDLSYISDDEMYCDDYDDYD